ncbi:methyltransferase [Sphingomonas sp.]|jgi:predicted methyltransferase|uniref:class I SAM-dependent methyltransferase n=1 Tax=Sphingomonas sp. TaxID=28214 RepID=UPI002E356AAD|nr:methyltransferase [Sphingomonas sp.]HEX4693523.1 methyltransferase [Sphingomonas sp.]
MRRTLIALLVAAAPVALYAAVPAMPAYVTAAVADTSRPDPDRATDVNRKPAETLAFAGVKPGMTVGEFYPGGGYFTRMLSDVVGPKGHIYGMENLRWGDPKADKAVIDAAKGGNVSIEAAAFGTVRFPKPLDLAWVTQNYHDLKIAKYGVVDTVAFDRGVFNSLKPGGTFFILDHEAPAGTDVAGITRLHRIERSQVIAEVMSVGFKLVDEGTFLRRPSDDHTLSIFDPKVRGQTDQYALKFVKPIRR